MDDSQKLTTYLPPLIFLLLTPLFLDHFDFWFDEQGVLSIGQTPWIQVLFNDKDIFHPPLFLWLAKLWYQLGSLLKDPPSPYFLKILPCLFGIGNWFLLLRKCKSKAQLFFIHTYLLTSNILLFYFQEFRPYTMWSFFFLIWIFDFEERRALDFKNFALLLISGFTHYLTYPFAFLTIGLSLFKVKHQIRRNAATYLYPPIFMMGAYFLFQYLKISSAPKGFQPTLLGFFAFFKNLVEISDNIQTPLSLSLSLTLLTYFSYQYQKRRSFLKLVIATHLLIGLIYITLKNPGQDHKRYLYPILMLLPLALSEGKERLEKLDVLFLMIFVLGNIWIFFRPQWGVRDFELRPKYTEAFLSLKEHREVTELYYCSALYIPFEKFYFYYPKYLQIPQTFYQENCPKEVFKNLLPHQAILVHKRSPFWKNSMNYPLIYESRRIKLIKGL